MNLENLKSHFTYIQSTMEELLNLDYATRQELYRQSENKVMDDVILEQYLSFSKHMLDESSRLEETQDTSEIQRTLNAYQEVIFDMLSFLKIEVRDDLTNRMMQAHAQLENYRA